MASQVKNESIYDVAKHFYFIHHIFGMAWFKFDSKTKKLKRTPQRTALFILTVAFWLFFIWHRFVNGTRFDTGSKSQLLDNIFQYQYSFQLVFALFVIINNFSRVKSIENMLKSLDSFDRQCHSLGWNIVGQKRLVALAFVFFGCGLVVTAVYTSFQYTLLQELSILHRIISCYVIMFFFFITGEFIFCAHLVKSRLLTLQSSVRKLSSGYNCHLSTMTLPLDQRRILVKQAAVSFDSLADAVDGINKVFSKQLVTVIVPAMIFEVYLTYFLIKIITYDLVIRPLVYAKCALWCMMLVIPKIYAIHVGAWTAEESRNLNTLVDRCSNDVDDDALFNQIKSLSSKIFFRPIIFNCGYFNIDWTLALSIFGTITTYMIIICQFEKDLDV